MPGGYDSPRRRSKYLIQFVQKVTLVGGHLLASVTVTGLPVLGEAWQPHLHSVEGDRQDAGVDGYQSAREQAIQSHNFCAS